MTSHLTQKLLRSYFRFEKDPAILYEQDEDPFAESAFELEIKNKDLDLLVHHLIGASKTSVQAWKRIFLEEEAVQISLQFDADYSFYLFFFVWEEIQTTIRDESLHQTSLDALLSLWDAFISSSSCELTEVKIPCCYLQDLILRIESFAEEDEIQEDLRALYLQSLNILCNKGDDWALQYKAYAYLKGNAVIESDPDICEPLLQQLALTGDPDAFYHLGCLYQRAEWVGSNDEKAFAAFSHASNLGHVAATYHLSNLYRIGRGCSIDIKKAYDLICPLYESEEAAFSSGQFDSLFPEIAFSMSLFDHQDIDGFPSSSLTAFYLTQAHFAYQIRSSRMPDSEDDLICARIEDEYQNAVKTTDMLDPFIRCLCCHPTFLGGACHVQFEFMPAHSDVLLSFILPEGSTVLQAMITSGECIVTSHFSCLLHNVTTSIPWQSTEIDTLQLNDHQLCLHCIDGSDKEITFTSLEVLRPISSCPSDFDQMISRCLRIETVVETHNGEIDNEKEMSLHALRVKYGDEALITGAIHWLHSSSRTCEEILYAMRLLTKDPAIPWILLDPEACLIACYQAFDHTDPDDGSIEAFETAFTLLARALICGTMTSEVARDYDPFEDDHLMSLCAQTSDP